MNSKGKAAKICGGQRSSMTYFLCPISQCVVMTLNPGVEMGIINKLYYNYYLRASISIISVPAAFAASIAGSILLSTESRSVIIWTCRTKIQYVPCNSRILHFVSQSTCFGSTVCSQVWSRRSNRDSWNFTVVLTDMKTPEQLVSTLS